MNASAPPATHASRNQVASGAAVATAGERNRMPPPMTLAMMMAAASKGPSRRSRTGGEVVVVVTRGLYGSLRELPTANSQRGLDGSTFFGNWELEIGSCVFRAAAVPQTAAARAAGRLCTSPS